MNAEETNIIDYLLSVFWQILNSDEEERIKLCKGIRCFLKYFMKVRRQKDQNLIRKNASEVLNHCVYIPSITPQLRATLNVLRSWDSLLKGHPRGLTHSLSWPHLDRYFKDFEEIDILGSGGFGQVMKARHRLDRELYAVKKVPIENYQDSQDALNEVRIFSKLRHPNIVLYHSSWIETDNYRPERLEYKDNNSHPITIREATSEDDGSSSSSDSVIFQDSKSNGSDKKDMQIALYSSTSSDGSSSDDNSNQRDGIFSLYIQMELGEDNLKNWILRRNASETFSWSKSEILNHFSIFKQILQALHYMHDNEFIHRDIKPANVIFSTDNRVLITDFGLSTAFSHSNLGMSDVGTATYLPLELNLHDYKIDIYSLGIILLELLHPFGTMSERARVLTRLKKERSLAADFVRNWGEGAKLVMRMTEKDAKDIPSADDILNEFFNFEDRFLWKDEPATSLSSNFLNRNISLPKCAGYSRRLSSSKLLHRNGIFRAAVTLTNRKRNELLNRRIKILENKISNLNLNS